MMRAQRLEQRILGITQIDAVDVRGDRPLDAVQVGRVDLFPQRGPCPFEIGMPTEFNRAWIPVDRFDVHT